MSRRAPNHSSERVPGPVEPFFALRKGSAGRSAAPALVALCLTAANAFAVRLDTGGPRHKAGPQILLRAVMANGTESTDRKTSEAIRQAGGMIVYKMAREGWYGVYYIHAAAADRGDILLALFGQGACRLVEPLPLEEAAESTHTARITLPVFPLNLYVKLDPARAKPEDLRARLKGACLKYFDPRDGRYWLLATDEARFSPSLASVAGLEDVRLAQPVALTSDLEILDESASTSTWAAQAENGFPDCPRPADAPPRGLETLVPPSQKDRPRIGDVTYYDAEASTRATRTAYLGQVRVTFKEPVDPEDAADIFIKHGGVILERPFETSTYFVQVADGAEGAFIASVLQEPRVAKATPELVQKHR